MCSIQFTGRCPIRTSRIVPPPIATSTAKTTAPSQSILARAAAITPDTANATVPMTSTTKNATFAASLVLPTRPSYCTVGAMLG